MPDAKPRYANFPDRSLKVLIGEHINPTNTKLLTKLTIGRYEMSFVQQENATATAKAIREIVSVMAKAEGMTVAYDDKHREYTFIAQATGSERSVLIWVQSPYELTQSAHLLWCKVSQADKVGVSFKINTKYVADDIANLVKAATARLTAVPADDAFVLKGNPAPRFQKKAKAADPAAEPAAG
jgi:hypothetical protein